MKSLNEYIQEVLQKEYPNEKIVGWDGWNGTRYCDGEVDQTWVFDLSNGVRLCAEWDAHEDAPQIYEARK